MDPIIGTVIAAAIGGVMGSSITAGASAAQSRRATREKARAALWAYQRALAGFATSQWNKLGYYETRAHFLVNDFKTVRTAYEEAYPWAGFVRPAARRHLFREAKIEIGELPHDQPDDIMAAADSADRLARDLEIELDRAFPLRFGDGLRARLPKRKPKAR